MSRAHRGWISSLSLYVPLLLLPAGVAAQMESNAVYGELRGAAVFPDDDALEVGGGVEAAVGYGHDTGLRGEVAFGFRHLDIDAGNSFASAEGDASLYTVLFNGYYDLDLGLLGVERGWATRLRPYGGFGIGLGIVDLEADLEVGGVPVGELNETDTEFAWQFALGSAYALSPNWALTAGWTFLDVNEEIHNLTLGLRYAF